MVMFMRMQCNNWLFAGGSSQKPNSACYPMTAATNEMANQMRTGETIDSSSMDTDRLVSSFTVQQ